MNLLDIYKSYIGQEDYKCQNIFKVLEYFNKNQLYPVFHDIESSGTAPIALIEGEKFLMFCSNNYLGLSEDIRVIESARLQLVQHGIGPGGSRFLCGNLKLLKQLEKSTANLVTKEDAITFPTGYMANVAVPSVMMDPLVGNFPYKKGTGYIFSDAYNHGSIVDGCKQTRAKKIIFQHNDIGDLEKKIRKVSKKTHKMIITEGVFTLEGEIAPLSDMVLIAKKYNAILMVDDAHGLGILGEHGGGTVEHLGLQKEVDIIMGSYDKALGGMGGFLAAQKEMIDYFRIAARSYILSSSVPAVMAGGVIEGIKIIVKEKILREKLFANANYLRDSLVEKGFTILGTGIVPVVPLLIGDEKKAINFSNELFKHKIFIPPFRWPAVPKGKARLRITPMAHHEKSHLNELIEKCVKVGRDLGVIS